MFSGKSSGLELWNPTSRQKRGRCGAPGVLFGGGEKLVDVVEEELSLEIFLDADNGLEMIAAFSRQLAQEALLIFSLQSGNDDLAGRIQGF